jgi:hypothetical protein
MAGVEGHGPFGGQVTPLDALRRAARSLSPPYEIAATGSLHLELRAGSPLPDVRLRLQRDRRMFSRTFALVVEASVPVIGPEHDASATLRRTGLRRQLSLAPGRSDGSPAWSQRLEDAGLLEGVEAMTNVVSLEAWRGAGHRAAGLRLTTLAGALIGTTPTSAVAVPMEPEDVQGLLRILRAFSDAAGRAPG